MNFKKGLSKFLALIICTTIIQTVNINKANAETSQSKIVKRIQGTDRFKTSMAIADEIGNTSLDNVVIASAYDFPDALSGSTLAKKLNAPLLLMGNLQDSNDILMYIATHLKVKGKVYILGGKAVISDDIKNKLVSEGYNVERLSGENRLETCNAVVESMNIVEGTPIFIASASGFADALSVSSIAAINGYPILLTYSNELSEVVKNQITKIKPSKVYIVGGASVVSENVEKEIKGLAPNSEITRLSGSNRYETSTNVYKYFNLQSNNIVLASGKDFPDALSGSLLASKLNSSIVLSDEENLDIQQKDFDEKGILNFYILGGASALSKNVERVINYNKDNEMNDVKTVLDKAVKAFNDKNIQEYMSTMDNSMEGYEELGSYYEYIFSSQNIHVSLEFKSVDITSINYKEASVKVVENAVAHNDDNNATSNVTTTGIYKLRFINGEWKIYNYTKLN